MLGRNVAANTPMMPGTDTIEKCMESFDQGSRMFFRGVAVEEGWKYQLIAPTSARLVFTGLFPANYARGMAEGFCKKFRPNVIVKIDETQTANYQVTLLVNW
jgi:hypothetical protein